MLAKKLAIGIAAFGSFLAVANCKTENTVHASTVAGPTSTVDSKFDFSVPEQFQDLDRLVVVKNNRYEINSLGKVVLPEQVYTELSKQLNSANEAVAKNGVKIDPTTKSFTLTSQDRASSVPSTKNFWWGTRYYFTSNKQVENMVYWLNKMSNNYELASVAAGAAVSLIPLPFIAQASGAAITTITALNALNLSRAALDLDHYNNNHKHDHIYMDMNTWLATYSFGTF